MAAAPSCDFLLSYLYGVPYQICFQTISGFGSAVQYPLLYVSLEPLQFTFYKFATSEMHTLSIGRAHQLRTRLLSAQTSKQSKEGDLGHALTARRRSQVEAIGMPSRHEETKNQKS